MKKRILSVLLGCSLLFGTVGVNAVSIEFEDLEQTDISEEQSMIEEVIIDENSISPEATNEIIEQIGLSEVLYERYEDEIMVANVDDARSSTTTSLSGYFTAADSVAYQGNHSVSGPYVIYQNSSIDISKYVVYHNAVNANNKRYDLVIYPFNNAGLYYRKEWKWN